MRYSNNYISQLIAKAITGELTGKEKTDLEAWLEKEENQNFFQALIDEDRLIAKDMLWRSAPTEAAYSKLMTRVMNPEKPAAAKRRGWKKYMAAAVLSGAVALGALLYDQQQEPVIEYQVVDTLKAPDHGAVLVLGDGSRVSLEHEADTDEKILGEARYNAKEHSLAYTPSANAGDQPEVFNTLIVPRGGIYNVALPDGSKAWVNANSELKYPVNFKGEERRVVLRGEAYFEVEKDKKQFIVETEGGEITVLGTSFNVSAYPEEKIVSSTLIEGSVRLSSKFSSADMVEIVPGERAQFSFDNYHGIEVEGVNVKHYVSWVEGKEYFEGMTLEKILNVASRWYDFKVKFSEESLKNIPFTGVMYREQNLEKLLDLISVTSGIKYEIRKTPNSDQYDLLIMKS